MELIRGIFDRIILVVSIVAAGCIPSFIAQYRQRIGGHLDQVLRDLAPFQEIAKQFHHGSLTELIQHHLASSDATFHKEGAALRAMLDSAEQLKAAFAALNSDLLHQMAYLAINTDPVIARATWEIFSPSFNLTMESVVFASIVGILIWLVFFVVWTIVASLINLLTAR